MAPLGNDILSAVKSATAQIPAGGGAGASQMSRVRQVAAGNTDAFGDASLEISGLAAGQYQAWNLFCQVQGGGSFSVAIDQGTMTVGGALGMGGQASGGPFITWGTDTVTVEITGAAPSSIAQVLIQGIQSPNLDDISNFTGPSYGQVGVAQSDPSKLLAGQVGAPLIDNQAYTVPGSGSHVLGLGTFDVTGYAALLIYGDPPPASQSLFAQIGWSDLNGDPIAFQQIDSLNPKFVAVLGCLGASVTIEVWNNDASAHAINNFSVIPLAAMPVHPELLIPLAGGGLPASITPATPPVGVIISGSQTLGFGTSVTFPGNFVWPGKAIWSVGSVSGSLVTAWDATLQCVDAAGVVTVIARLGSGVANPPPVLVQLTSGTPQVIYHNSGTSGSQSPQVELIATS